MGKSMSTIEYPQDESSTDFALRPNTLGFGRPFRPGIAACFEVLCPPSKTSASEDFREDFIFA
jgi:hypothetical protein